MNALTILAGGTATTLGLACIPLAVALGASPINRARDARHQADTTACADRETAELVAQIHAGVHTASLVDSDPGKLAAAAYAAASGLAGEVADEDLALVGRILLALEPILNAEGVPIPEPSTAPDLTDAAALQLLLHRLAQACDGPRLVQVRVAGTWTTEVLRYLPNGRAVDFNPLTEHDPVSLHLAQAAWICVAQAEGMGGWERALIADGETTVAVTR